MARTGINTFQKFISLTVRPSREDAIGVIVLFQNSQSHPTFATTMDWWVKCQDWLTFYSVYVRLEVSDPRLPQAKINLSKTPGTPRVAAVHRRRARNKIDISI
jgi:hypothetical protein